MTTPAQNSSGKQRALRTSGSFPLPTSRAVDRSDRRQRFVQAVRESPLFDSPELREQAEFMAYAVRLRADGEFIARHPVEAFAHHVHNGLQRVAIRKPDEILVGCSRPQKVKHGYDLPMVVLETCMADQPFIIDTIKLVLKRLDVPVLGTLNMILPVERSADHKLVDLTPDNPQARPESFSCHMLSPSAVGNRGPEIRQAIAAALERAQRIANDFRMTKRLVRDMLATLQFCADGARIGTPDFAEEVAFGNWLIDENFIFMGAYGFDAQGRPTGRLGLGRYDKADHAGCETDPATAFSTTAPLVSIHQSRIHSPIHRDAPLVEVRMRLFDGEGNPDGGVVFQGLFTYKADTGRASQVPFLRGKLGRMVAAEDLVPASHRMKLFLSFFDRLPMAFSMTASEQSLCAVINEAIDVDFGGPPRVWYRCESASSAAQVFAIVPANRYSDAIRNQLRDHLRSAFGADEALIKLLHGKTDALIVDLLLFAKTPLQTPDPDALSDALSALVTPMLENLREALRTTGSGEQEIDTLCLQFGSSLGDLDADWTDPKHLLKDLRSLAAVAAGGPTEIRLRCDVRDAAQKVIRLLVYTPVDIALTDILPILDNFGVRVLGERTDPVTDTEGRTVYFETYKIASDANNGPQLLEHADAFIAGLHAVMDGRVNSTSLNRLLLAAKLNWRQLQVMRAYLAYARQLGVTFASTLVQQVLHNQPGLVTTLMELFDARFNPLVDGKARAANDPVRTAVAAALDSKFRDQLRTVQDAVEDKVLRMFRNFVLATLRTNFFQLPDEARGMAFKFRCKDVELMQEPRPMFEIWVYDPRVEGIHLRGGKVARGGLRWSDRLDDFRTEILGLMQTQMVKNTLIVPVGSKGGFVLKKPERDDAARRRQADELYKVFIHGLLDLTDNLVKGKAIHPDDVVVYDEADPYLVVAADKGTAHLSDTANGIAQGRGFWLGDAFASGGSKGYDHKLYGITAKGGWVCVQRHFREMGIDTQKDVFTANGIGDMSGDVFGNGALLTQTVKFLAVFDHRHIFLDPDPDPLVSWTERKRLFDTPRSNWVMYDAAKISAGGGVYPRTAKSIALSAQAQAMLGVQQAEMSGDELMHAILQMPVDLFWNGGIGTFVKSSHESHADAGDKANDNIRVDATQLRCKVVGEGGNLGFTQAARVEAALGGVRLNTDAVDNSAGVDLSDHEVNLKIAFAPLLQDGRIDFARRDPVLFEIDERVCELVIHNNDQQSQGLSVQQLKSPARMRQWGDAIRFLVAANKIDQVVQMLPSKAVIAERRKHGQGLTRPELARITAFAKMWIFNELSADRGSTEPVAKRYLEYYFPPAVRDRYPEAVDGHMLRHEIVATLWTNAIVDFAGAALLPRLAMEYGRTVTELCQTYTFACDVLGLDALRRQVAALNYQVPATVQYEALVEIEDAAAAATEWLLANLPGETLRPYLARGDALAAWAGDTVAQYQNLVQRGRQDQVARAKAWIGQGMPETLAHDLTTVALRPRLFAVWQVGQAAKLAALPAAAVTFATAEVTGLDALLGQISTASPQTRWESAALSSLGGGLADTLARLAVRVAQNPKAQSGRDAVRKILVDELKLGSLWELAEQIAAEGVQIPALVVLSERLRARLR
ncbi:MAG: NAD-glutamate dehydrogenase [Deltaproteobacteria bacterium]|nr:NAD-glutamate dehydrogenase [Deltaproteobacteria bacterium]